MPPAFRRQPPPPWFLSKPIGSQAFLELLDRLEPRLRDTSASALRAPSAATTAPPDGSRGKSRSFRQAARGARTAKAARTLEAASFRHFIRSVPDADPGDPRQRGHSTYDPRRHLQVACARAAASGKAQRLRGPWRDILILPDTGEVIADLDEARLRSMTVIPVDGHGQVLLSELAAEEAEALRGASAGTPERQETFLWKVALWSSRGRLPGDTAWETPVRLRHWTNLTRLVLTPHALQLAALWVRRRCTLITTLLRLDETPPLELEGLRRWCGVHDNGTALDLLHHLQTLGWLEGLATPRRAAPWSSFCPNCWRRSRPPDAPCWRMPRASTSPVSDSPMRRRRRYPP